jgi:hypothetical protein
MRVAAASFRCINACRRRVAPRSCRQLQATDANVGRALEGVTALTARLQGIEQLIRVRHAYPRVVHARVELLDRANPRTRRREQTRSPPSARARARARGAGTA